MRACVGVRMSVEAGMMSFREREGGVSAGGGGGGGLCIPYLCYLRGFMF